MAQASIAPTKPPRDAVMASATQDTSAPPTQTSRLTARDATAAAIMPGRNRMMNAAYWLDSPMAPCGAAVDALGSRG